MEVELCVLDVGAVCALGGGHCSACEGREWGHKWNSLIPRPSTEIENLISCDRMESRDYMYLSQKNQLGCIC